MKESNWELIAKHLAGETTAEEKNAVLKLLQSDEEFKSEFNKVKQLWGNIEAPSPSFDKARIKKLTEQKIKAAQKQSFQWKKVMKYAAVFIGLLMVFGTVILDITSTKTVSALKMGVKEHTLPDGSIVSLHKEAIISYSNSRILNFDREVCLTQGEAFFNIVKSDNAGFTVVTPNYDINVLGTMFDVKCNDSSTEVVLEEGKVELNKFDNASFDGIVMAPGNKVNYGSANSEPIISQVNPYIYSLWKENKMEFKRFSVNELAEIFRIYFNKVVIIKDIEISEKRIGGSAPSDDLDLILLGISDVLQRSIIHRNDSIIIE